MLGQNRGESVLGSVVPKSGSSGRGQARGGPPGLQLRRPSLGERAEIEAAIRRIRKFMFNKTKSLVEETHREILTVSKTDVPRLGQRTQSFAA